AAMRHHQAGQLAEAERLYVQVLAAEPGHLHALMLSGALAHMAGRQQDAADRFGRALAINEQPDIHFNLGLAKWGLGQRSDAMAHWERALALNPDFAPAHMNLGNALREDGRTTEAVTHLRRALALQPSPFAHNNLGLALAVLGDSEAAGHFRRAIEMHPQFVEPYLNLALELANRDDLAQALSLVQRSLRIAETADNKALFVRLASAQQAIGNDPDLRALVTRAVTEGWERASDLAPIAVTLVKSGGAFQSGTTALADEPLLRWLLTSGVVCDEELERFLTRARKTLLGIAENNSGTMDGIYLDFAGALARQCFINEYVYAVGDDERVHAKSLRDSVIAAAGIGAAVPPAHIALVAAYFPLHMLPVADALLRRSWPEPVAAVIDQQIREPHAEADSRAAIPRLTPIEDGVSRLVQQQYEQNPYPRWITLEPLRKYDSIDALMRREYPHAPFRPTGRGGNVDILIAGCGTGRHSIGIAQQFERSKVLAIDLSAASLGYARARTGALGVTNIDYAQADILQLGSLGRTFDMIQSAGVLHHLADPWAGWRVLNSLLRPGGVMFIALYSETARRDVVAARAFIAERGFGSSLDDIRSARAEMMAQADGSPLRNVAFFNDFFTTSECRDLLFHVQEHRMTLPAIRDFLAASGLTFLGFEVDFRTAQLYAARFPADRAMTDLDQWHAFEQDRPYSFASMYRFWVQKPV
ncbi:MAG TPA: tetratricopeptide repeat protein, partial [Xanthobacteraceae bacterium]|nr:tetratricopeptide repeat protein [Xanthobacteraceae bacterium]